MPNLVDNEDDLRTANAMFGSTWGIMLAVGAALGGLFSAEMALAPWSLEKVWDLIKHAKGWMLWETGYADMAMSVDMNTLRYLPWHDGTAMVKLL